MKNKTQNAGMGILFLVSLRSVMEKGKAFSITAGSPSSGKKASKMSQKTDEPFNITVKVS